MEGAPLGLIEVVLVFALVLGWACWEVVRNRTQLRRMKSGEARADPRRPDSD